MKWLRWWWQYRLALGRERRARTPLAEVLAHRDTERVRLRRP